MFSQLSLTPGVTPGDLAELLLWKKLIKSPLFPQSNSQRHFKHCSATKGMKVHQLGQITTLQWFFMQQKVNLRGDTFNLPHMGNGEYFMGGRCGVESLQLHLRHYVL